MWGFQGVERGGGVSLAWRRLDLLGRKRPRGRRSWGFTTKLHLAVEQGEKPMSIVVTAGQCGDSPQF